MSTSTPSAPSLPVPRWKGHLAIARFDHWVKNVFVLPGIVIALTLYHYPVTWELIRRTLFGLIAIGIVASSNYVINEICDAPFDRFHPLKRHRPVPAGAVMVPLAYAQWILLGIAGVLLASRISERFALTAVALWIMGCIYNLKPVRSKDIPYVDVLTEAVNNPLRLAAGWFIVSSMIPPASLLISYWMLGCYFMALKRYAEHLRLQEHGSLGAYRKSLDYFTPESILYCVIFYGSTAMLFFGAFLMRYRIELVLSFPFISLVMAIYFSLAFKRDGAAEHPEKLYREPKLVISTAGCTAVMLVCLLVDMHWISDAFTPTAPVSSAYGEQR